MRPHHQPLILDLNKFSSIQNLKLSWPALREKLIPTLGFAPPGDNVTWFDRIRFDFLAEFANNLVQTVICYALPAQFVRPGIYNQIRFGVPSAGMLNQVMQNRSL